MAAPTAVEMARAVDYLRQRIDQIEGTDLVMPEWSGDTIRLHTPSQVVTWLDTQFARLAEIGRTKPAFTCPACGQAWSGHGGVQAPICPR